MLCHSFPGLSFSWRHQLPALTGAGWRAIAPDMRGYGRSDRPTDPSAYDRASSVADPHRPARRTRTRPGFLRRPRLRREPGET
ncbi:alpha/beta fold hydrolase [Rhodococcus jostii]|uniref:alpha/beta fold hydrolase n=1 Tax=Rhodococcus jostii TaxID=132919 RepID=UPI0009351B38|nr:alpha/beta fold hydrolase [Rhodococcus jostii]